MIDLAPLVEAVPRLGEESLLAQPGPWHDPRMASPAIWIGLAAALSAPAAENRVGIGRDAPSGLRIEWAQAIASPGDDWINDIFALAPGEFGLAGFVDRADAAGADWRSLYARISQNGQVRARHEFGAGRGIDAFWAGAAAADGETWLAGFTSRIGAGGIDAWAARIAADGKLLEEKTFGGGGYDRFTSLAATADGYVLVGHSEPPDVERRRLFAVKLDRRGSAVWQRTIDADPDALAALYVAPAGDGGLIVAGGLRRGEDSDIFILKLDGGGQELWRRTVGTAAAPDVNHGLLVKPDGTIVVAGYVKSWGSRDNDILAATFSPAGVLLKKALLGGAGDDRPISLKPGPAGEAWVVGYTKSASSAGDWDVLVARLDSRGEFMPGVATLGSTADDNGTAIHALDDGGAIAAGYSKGLGSASEDAFVVRLSPADWTRPNPAFARRVVP
ncbi:hypothetical protein [Sphingomonas sp.]|uniref:hypothetical protein n=1 Tax=Sphingomonas sp. TaxID=28214 RepID=UPI00286DAC10|nr:hypothetical protein [Sphingomonas sp.]